MKKQKIYSEADMGDMSHYDPNLGAPKAHKAKGKQSGGHVPMHKRNFRDLPHTAPGKTSIRAQKAEPKGMHGERPAMGVQHRSSYRSGGNE